MAEHFGVRFGLYYDDDQEITEELAPDPFSEEPRSLAHKRRYGMARTTQRPNPPQNKKKDSSGL